MLGLCGGGGCLLPVLGGGGGRFNCALLKYLQVPGGGGGRFNSAMLKMICQCKVVEVDNSQCLIIPVLRDSKIWLSLLQSIAF